MSRPSTAAARRSSDGPIWRLVDDASDLLSQGTDEVRAYLASAEGVKLRRRVAQAMILGAPRLLRSPIFRTTPLGRLVGLLGGTAVLVKAAEALRDWEPAVAAVESADLEDRTARR